MTLCSLPPKHSGSRSSSLRSGKENGPAVVPPEGFSSWSVSECDKHGTAVLLIAPPTSALLFSIVLSRCDCGTRLRLPGAEYPSKRSRCRHGCQRGSGSEADGSIGTVSVGTASVDTASIGTNSVGTDSVGADSIGNGSVGNGSVGSDSVGTGFVGTSSVDTASVLSASAVGLACGFCRRSSKGDSIYF